MKPHPTQKTNFPVRCFLSGPCTSGPSGPKWENYKHRLHQIFQSGLMIFINQPPSIQFPLQILRRALLYLAIRSWTVAVVLDLAVLWTWGLIARNILEDQIPFNQIELSLAPTRDSYWIDLRNILRKPWFVASNILWGFRFQFSDPIVRCKNRHRQSRRSTCAGDSQTVFIHGSSCQVLTRNQLSSWLVIQVILG